MIHVDVKPEPASFDKLVRRRGRKFLGSCAAPVTNKQWQTHSYWRDILPDLHRLYDGICAYSCEFIPPITGVETVEHFLAKANYPDDAYEWNNYRLVCLRMNGRKGTRLVVDPFVVQNGWFCIDFPSLQIMLNTAQIPPASLGLSCDAIDVLDLNGEASVKSRERWVKDYCLENINRIFLQQNAPFIYSELERQGLLEHIREMMRFT